LWAGGWGAGGIEEELGPGWVKLGDHFATPGVTPSTKTFVPVL
jgi:hypothetical protein